MQSVVSQITQLEVIRILLTIWSLYISRDDIPNWPKYLKGKYLLVYDSIRIKIRFFVWVVFYTHWPLEVGESIKQNSSGLLDPISVTKNETGMRTLTYDRNADISELRLFCLVMELHVGHTPVHTHVLLRHWLDLQGQFRSSLGVCQNLD